MTNFKARSATALALALCAGAALLSACATPNPVRYEQLGDRAMSEKDYNAAADAYAKALERRPGEASTRNAYGRALMAAGRNADAVEPLRVAHDQVPTNRQYTDDLCNALYAAGRGEEAFRLLRGIAEGNGLPADWLQLGQFAARSGDPDTAKTALLTAARLDRGRSIEPQLALADLYAQIGDRTNAGKRLRNAFYVDRKDPGIEKRAKAWGEIIGPTYAVQPPEQNEIIKGEPAPK